MFSKLFLCQRDEGISIFRCSEHFYSIIIIININYFFYKIYLVPFIRDIVVQFLLYKCFGAIYNSQKQKLTYNFCFLLRMEPPHHIFLGSEEECHSSESGWTMYIGSPINHEDENFDHDHDYDDNNNKVHYYQTQGIHQTQVDAGIESDDSMASDASSGPSHPLGIYEGGYDLKHFKKNVEEGEYVVHQEYYCLDHHKKGNRKKENQIGEKKQKTQIQGGGKVKVRKNQRVGTRK